MSGYDGAMNLPEPSAPEAPKYWMDETGGQLARAIKRYVAGHRPMTAQEIGLIRAYFKQWIDSPVWDMNPHLTEAARAELQGLRADANKIATAVDIGVWLDAADALEMDPL